MSGPRLYRGNYRSPSVARNPSVLSGSGRMAGSGSTARTNPRANRSVSSARGLPRVDTNRPTQRSPGFNGFQAQSTGRDYRAASSYRDSLASRSGRRGAGAPRGDGQGGAARGEGRGQGHRRGRDHYHYRGHDHFHVNLAFGFHGFGLGFGYYHGGYYHNPFWYRSGYYGYFGYRSRWYASSWWYPWYSGCWYPYYWSYQYYPSYRSRTVYVYDTASYTSSGYYYGAGFDDDPYAEDDFIDGGARLAPTEAESTVESLAFSTPFAPGVNAGATFEAAMSAGDAAMRAQNCQVAAECYRQAWQLRNESQALTRMSIALFAAGDYPMAAVAMVGGLAPGEKALLEYAVALGTLNGPVMTRSVAALERYLVENPNDEASNLLLGGVYALSGQEFAGHLILTRLRAAEFETGTCDLLITQARTAMGH